MSGSEPNNVAFYNKLWLEEWRDMVRFNPTIRHLEKIIVDAIERVGPVQTVLDVGCGMGVNLKRIRRHFPDPELVGADLSEDILKIARHYVGEDPKIKYSPLDIGKGALDRQFDFVLCSQVLEHIEDDKAAISYMSEMCSKYLFITVPGGRYNTTSKLVGHHRHYSKKDLVEKVVTNGFTVCHVREWGFPFHSLYKSTLNLLPAESQKQVGFGRYGFFKKKISDLLYLLFFANVFDMGANVILLAEKKYPRAHHR